MTDVWRRFAQVSANGKGFTRGLVYWFALAIPSVYTNSMASPGQKERYNASLPLDCR